MSNKIDEALGVIESVPKLNVTQDVMLKSQEDFGDLNDAEKDYEYQRQNFYNLVERGTDAVEGILELAKESDHPRAYEVAGQLIKSVADTTDKLIDLQKKVKEVEEDNIKTTNNVTNNAVFVGSTSDLQKMLKQGFLNNKE